jgi:hypothetical protein
MLASDLLIYVVECLYIGQFARSTCSMLFGFIAFVVRLAPNYY